VLSGWPLAVVYNEYPVSSLMTGLVSYWPMKEEGGNRLDSFGRSSFVLQNGVPERITGPFKDSYAAKLRRSSEHWFKAPASSWQQIGIRSATWAVWLRFNSLVVDAGWGAQAIINLGSGVSNSYLLRYRTSENALDWFVVRDGGVGSAQADDVGLGQPVLNTWYLVWCWNDLANKTIGIQTQGYAESTDTYPDSIWNIAEATLNLGRQHSASLGKFAPLDADVGPIALWHRLLSQSEKDAYYNDGNGLVPEFLGVPN